jgi:glutathione S-transferase
MSLTLLYSPTSPYVRKVDVLLREADLRDRVADVPGSGTPLEPNAETLLSNPLGKIPALIRDDGPTLYDSRVICRYLDTTLAGGRFYPEGRLWEVLTLEATADGILDAALLMVYEARMRPDDKRHDPWVEGQWAKIARSLDAIEARWLSHLEGPVTMAQIAVACALGYVDFRHAARDWRAGRPGLAAWFAAFEDRPSMQATIPAG